MIFRLFKLFPFNGYDFLHCLNYLSLEVMIFTLFKLFPFNVMIFTLFELFPFNGYDFYIVKMISLLWLGQKKNMVCFRLHGLQN